MAKKDETPDAPQVTDPDSPETLTLDRTFVHGGVFYGPGEVSVHPAVAADFRVATERARKLDEERDGFKRAIDAREDNRREQERLDDANAPKSKKS